MSRFVRPPFPYKLGLNPSDPAVLARYSFPNYVDEAALPPLPEKIGHQNLLPVNLGMLGNDTVGDCVIAGADHEVMMWNADANKEVVFSTSTALADYSAITGYNPDDPNSDQGTNPVDAAKYRMKTGMIDVQGNRHKIDAWVSLDPKNVNHLQEALYLFGAVGLAWALPDSAQTQFQEGKPWAVVRGATIEGGHYTPLVGWDGTYYWIITWGRLQAVKPTFVKKYLNEALAYISLESLTDGKTLDGFDLATLQEDLKLVS